MGALAGRCSSCALAMMFMSRTRWSAAAVAGRASPKSSPASRSGAPWVKAGVCSGSGPQTAGPLTPAKRRAFEGSRFPVPAYNQDSCWLAGCWSGSYDQGGNECGEQGFAATACVVHDLEEAEVVRQLVLRDAPVRAQPGAQQRPEPLDGVDVHLAEPIPVLVAGVFAAPMAAHGSPWQTVLCR